MPYFAQLTFRQSYKRNTFTGSRLACVVSVSRRTGGCFILEPSLGMSLPRETFRE